MIKCRRKIDRIFQLWICNTIFYSKYSTIIGHPIFSEINDSSSLLCQNTCFCNRFNLNSRLCSNVQDLFVTFVLILWMTNLNSQLKKRKKSGSTVFLNVASIWFYATLVPTTPQDHQQLIKWWDVAHCMRKWAHRISSLGALLAGR